MAKEKKNRINKDSATIYAESKHYFINKYYNLFMSLYKWGGLDRQQEDYIMRKFWADGKVGAFAIKNLNEIGFAPFVETKYNAYDFPSSITLIDTRNVGWIPKKEMNVNEDVVIGYAQRNRKPIKLLVDYLVEQICNAELLISIAQDTLKLPFLIVVNDADKERMQTLINSLMNGESKLFGSVADFDSIKTLVNSNPYILDKLYSYKIERENELKTYLGIDNSSQAKTQYVNIDDVNSNNNEIAQSNTTFLDEMKIFCEEIKEHLGFNISVELKQSDIINLVPNTNGGEEDEISE